jgi:hypothetical protein
VGLIRAVQRGTVEPVAGVEAFEGDGKVLLLDGTVVAPECVIAATGYRRGLEDLVGHLGVLDERGQPRVRAGQMLGEAPGLHFTGFTNPISGMLREISREADRVARAIVRASR